MRNWFSGSRFFLILPFLAAGWFLFQTPPSSPAAPLAQPAPNPPVGSAVLQPPVLSIPPKEDETLPVPKQQEEIRQELSLAGLVVEVLARNPSLAQMTAAWEAASARYPQVTSLDDPMFAGMIAPSSFGSNAVEPGYRVEVSQKLPFPGKLRLRGQRALAESSAARNDVDDMRVRLIEAARLAFYDYFLVDRAISVNQEGLRLLKEFRQNAETRYKTGLVPQQDLLQADVEIGRQRERGVTLERVRKVAMARINTLRNVPPDEPLLPAPQKLGVGAGLPPVAGLQALALSQRPDLKALQDRIAVEQAALAVALRDYYPDAEVLAAYDTIMGNGPSRDLAPQIGFRLNLPVRLGRRHAAVAEAQAKIVQKQAELMSQVNQVQFQVQEAYAQLVESQRILALYNKEILPAAEKNVKAAQAAYVAGKIPFLSLIEAERNVVNLRDRYFEATADYFRRQANLERVIAAPLGRRD
jgi:outer membrane protein TolC